VSARFAGLRVLVTGTAGGIGRAVVDGFLAAGATVFAIDRAAPAYPSAAQFKICDIADRAAVDRVVDAIVLGGPIDVLVHAAARLGDGVDFLSVRQEDWLDFLSINLTGAFNVGQAVGRRMVGRGGSIVFVGSVNSMAAEPQAAPYAAAKGGLLMLTRAMAVDLARHEIRVNLIAPGPITVPRNAELFARPEMHAAFARAIPAGAPGKPDDVARAAVFLADPDNRFVTGATIVVDGGLTAQILPP
jgi:NAD(P)-dependent dehydrogenase (short-subunit alcohol dehydrogenase family)